MNMNLQKILFSKKKQIFILILVIWSLWLSFEFFIFGKNSFVRVHDCAESNLSFRMAISLIINNENYFPSWIPNFACGVDSLIMNNISPFTYDYLLFLLLPPWLAYIIIMILQRLLGTLFTYFLCRKIYCLPELISLLASMCFSLGTWSVNDWTLYDQLGPPLIPLFIYLIEKIYMQKSYLKYLNCIFIGLMISYLTFFPLFTPFFLFGAFIWFVAIRGKELKMSLVFFFIIGIFSTILELPQLLAIFSNAVDSGRSIISSISVSLSSALNSSFAHLVDLLLRYKLITLISIICFCILKMKNKQLNRFFYTIIGLVIFSKIMWIVSVTNRENLNMLSLINFNDFLIIYPFMLIIFMCQTLNCFNRYTLTIGFERED